MDQRREPRSDVAAARDGRQVVEVRQHVLPGERLQDAEVERRAADTAARESQADQRVAGGRRLALGAQAGELGRVYLFEVHVDSHTRGDD